MARPSPYQISAFTHAVREGSFSRAAAALGVTQSSITQHVANLEAHMGTQVLVRRRDGLELTRAGRELFELSDRMVTIEQLIGEKIDSYGAFSEGHLRIVATAPRPALPIIERFTQNYPGVALEFSLFSWTLCGKMVKDRSVDVAIFTAPEPEAGVYMREIAKTRYRIYMRREHRLAGRKILSLKDLEDECVILPEDGSLTQRIVNAKLLELGLRLPRTLKTTTFPVLKESILHGIGVGFLLENTLYPTTSLVGVPVVEMPETYADCLVTQSDKRDLRLVRSFLECARDPG